MLITMPYHKDISKNSYKWKTRGTKASVKRWMELLAAKAAGEDKYPFYEIRVKGYFWDERRPDMQNFIDVISDALQIGLATNDKHFQFHDGGYELGFSKQYLEIRIEGRTSR